MTEYDYSPEAYDAYIRKQQQIARWVDNTNHAPALRNPFTPATPAVRARDLRQYDSDHDDHRDPRRNPHRRHTSADTTVYQRDRYRDRDRDRDSDRERDRERDRDRDRERDRPRNHHDSQSPTQTQQPQQPQQPKRHRSTPHPTAVSPTRPEQTRKYSVPPPLPLPQYPVALNPNPAYYPYPSRIVSPRDSRHSSHSSTTQVPSPTSYYPPQQPPYSAPVYKQTPVRSHTTPAYYHQQNYSYPSPPYGPQNYYHHPKPSDYDPQNFPKQYSYQPKQPPLLKRIFMGLTGSKKQHQQHRVIQRKKSSSSF